MDEESINNSNTLLQDESFKYLSEMFEDGKCISHLELYQDIHNLISASTPKTIITTNFIKSQNDITFNAKNVPFTASKQQDCFNIIQNYLNGKYRVIVALSTNENILTLEEGLDHLNLDYELVHPKTKECVKKMNATRIIVTSTSR